MPIKTTQNEAPTLNLTPMIDVVFLLIIFFMVGTKFTTEERKIELNVPKIGNVKALSAAPKKRIVHVKMSGEIFLEETAVSINQLTDSLRNARSQYPELSVAVRGDAEGTFQNVAAVLAACRTAGVTDMAISVRLSR